MAAAGRNDASASPRFPVRKLPVPCAPLVKLSASNLDGKISQRLVSAIRSVQVCFVVFFIPIRRGVNLLIIASNRPDRMNARRRSIQKP